MLPRLKERDIWTITLRNQEVLVVTWGEVVILEYNLMERACRDVERVDISKVIFIKAQPGDRWRRKPLGKILVCYF